MVQLSLVTNAMRIPAFGGGGGWGGWFNQPSNRGMTWVQQGQPLHQPWAVVVWEWLVGWLVGAVKTCQPFVFARQLQS